MLNIDRQILEKISLRKEMNDISAQDNASQVITNIVNQLHSNHIEIKNAPQNEAHIDDALRA